MMIMRMDDRRKEGEGGEGGGALTLDISRNRRRPAP